MRLDYTHAMAVAYADAFDAEASEAAELARLLGTLADATLAHPYALARRLVAAGFACRDRDGCRFGFDATEANVRAVLGPAVSGFARFTRYQLAFTFDEEPTVMIDTPAPTAPILPPTDTAMPAPCAVAGLISYCVPGRYGWMHVGAVSAADAMRQAARGTSMPLDRAKLMVHDGWAWIPAAPDSSEGAPVSLGEFWARYGAEVAGAIEAGSLPYRVEWGVTAREQSARLVANGQRHVAADGWAILAYDGPAMKATLKAFGVWGGKVRFTRAAALAFVRGLA